MQFLFKSLGLDITPETMAMLQALIPQLPAKINEAAQAINAALANFDARLRALEIHAFHTREQLNRMEEVLKNGRTEPEPIGAGRRGRARSGAGASGIDGARNGGGSNDAGG